jgi:hypothetical protein
MKQQGAAKQMWYYKDVNVCYYYVRKRLDRIFVLSTDVEGIDTFIFVIWRDPSHIF